ncbi:MAG: Sua5/YciO/YrdC/YwlC family protein, partial [Dehalococcoidales bacterium]|nr:Sua5/YciO/YrdC/YwlC family protein [Dehalococcoidales bacterium]
MTTIQDMIQKGAEILTKGGIVVYPTDTVYGLGACFDNISSVTRIYEIKNRPFSTALPILLADT